MRLTQYFDSLRSKNISVLGAGISNQPLIRALLQAGVTVKIFDKAPYDKNADFYNSIAAFSPQIITGEDYLEQLDGDVIFRTPGLHPHHPALRRALNNGSVLTSEMEVFFSLCPCKTIAVTGSDGKSTTSTIIAELLKKAGYKVHLGGNIGNPLLTEVDSFLVSDIAVLELSSFQLHSMFCSPTISVVTNISPNHLDVHPSYEDYIDAKKQIFLHQSKENILVINADNEITASFEKMAAGRVLAFSRKNKTKDGFYCGIDGNIYSSRGEKIVSSDKIRIPGVHNIENFMAAFCAVCDLVSADIMTEVAETFPGVPHRLETCVVHNDITFINDSIASSPGRTIAGLACFSKKVILIAGGKDKGLSFDGLGDAICQRCKKVFLTGPTAPAIEKAIKVSALYKPREPAIYVFEDFRKMVEEACLTAEPGDTVLFSPASTSFDRFKNFEERGQCFKNIVGELLK